jgi:hypothetical protein
MVWALASIYKRAINGSYFADDPPSEPIGAQAVTRVRRLSVPSPVEAVTHYTPKSINDRRIKNNVCKAFPELRP